MILPAERESALATLKEMTKDEIIAWVSREIGFLFRPPCRSQLLFARYQMASDAVMARSAKNNLREGVAQAIDRYRASLNKAKDHNEFLAIAKEAEPYEREFKAWLDECKAIRKEEKKVEAIYSEYMKQSDKESEARRLRSSRRET